MSGRPTAEMAEKFLNCRIAFKHKLTCGQCGCCNHPDGRPMKRELIPATTFKAMYGMTKAEYRRVQEMKKHLHDDIVICHRHALRISKRIVEKAKE